uniref:Uncharacterized protein n=1 Tax=Compsopogon caeruleus TaxID=31354 RepID=A0A7S1TEM8_9RHOD|mmetsp:Transcript_3775/g.7215  ORF Transcript_3775/g.7215 Transcript_3775/m.7215 type:complete len:158 (+) Transcript_3775:145-618(+)|eukprot:CAMPEP_0184688574 /NCGR_PEP_ID=MMETSP0312-20130426/30173_1 /TAXON_ID=31354 /ORGANISM="Compsopogon coeruleus, Strain SAG 36.94" /LENGTH=157 /DNA_ID=CAMNT_0027145825 /DNA_START=85 /DNA_END=558 /DNA_ORIENTATION=+
MIGFVGSATGVCIGVSSLSGVAVSPRRCVAAVGSVRMMSDDGFQAPESYERRGFSESLPQNWTGEVDTVGASAMVVAGAAAVTEAPAEEEVDPEADAAFKEYAQIMQATRAAELAKQGQQLVGPEFVSNTRDILRLGVECVEYWNAATYESVPRRFG